MKDLVVATVALLLGALGPQSYQESPFDPLWILGTILLVAYSLGQLAGLLRLPPMLGWIAAGLLVGNSGFQLMNAQMDDILRPVRHAAAVWVAFQVGIHAWPISWLDWRRGGIVFASTLSVFLAVALGGVLLAELSWPFALLLAATASLWGAFTGVPAERLRYVLQVGVVGGCLSLIILSVVLLWAAAEGTVQTDAISFVGRLTLSLVIGAVSAAIVRFFRSCPGACTVYSLVYWRPVFPPPRCLKWFRYPSYPLVLLLAWSLRSMLNGAVVFAIYYTAWDLCRSCSILHFWEAF